MRSRMDALSAPGTCGLSWALIRRIGPGSGPVFLVGEGGLPSRPLLGTPLGFCESPCRSVKQLTLRGSKFRLG
jgi:hypothetical protein